MIGTPVLHHTHVLVSAEDPPQTPEGSFKLGEKESFILLNKCSNVQEFKRAHAHIVKLGLFLDSVCASHLLSTCALSDWGSMDYACSIFRQMDEPGSFDFNTMMRGHVRDMNMEEALLTYDEMVERRIDPDKFTYPALLKACARIPALEEGKQIHGHILKFGFADDVFVQNSLICMYGKCGEVGFSRAVFEQMSEHSVASWSALITAHASVGMWSDCLGTLGEMNSEGCWRAAESNLVSILSACTHLGALDLGRSVIGFLHWNMSGLNVIVETSLMEMYMKCGALQKGASLFQNMAKKNKQSYNVLYQASPCMAMAEKA